MNKSASPPKLALRFFRWYCHPGYLEDIEGDLLERFETRAAAKGMAKARWRFVLDVIRLFRPGIIRPWEGSQQLNHYDMFRNYFKTGLRSILRHKAFSFINIFGLAVAMSVCMLIILMLADQKSYDRFHKNKDRTYRILSKIKQSTTPNASSPFPLANTLKEEYVIVEEATHLIPRVGGDITEGKKTREVRGFFADPSFFDVFGFKLEEGNRKHALDQPNSIVITSELARFLFNGQDPLGKRVEFYDRGLKLLSFDLGSDIDSSPVNWGSFTITGVIDSKKYKSHLKFDALISTPSLPALYEDGKVNNLADNWREYSYCYTYVVLDPRNDVQDLTFSLDDLVSRKYSEFENLKGFKLVPQALTHVTPGIFTGNPTSLRLPVEAYYFLGFLALLIMISSCLNYTNLSIARALTRAREVGIRKVNGAYRANLVLQFLSESVLAVLFAMTMANILLLLVKPAFMGLWVNHYLNFDLDGSLFVYLVFLGFAVLTGLVAGIFPALHLSRFSPVKVLKDLGSTGPRKLGIRKILSTFQFVLSLFFIITSLLIIRQFNHFMKFDYGFDAKNIVNIPMQGNDYRLLSDKLAQVPGVLTVSACEFIPATDGGHGVGVKRAGSTDKHTRFEAISVDPNFIHTLGLSLVAGRYLPEEAGPSRFIVVNEAAVKALGYQAPSEMLGQTFEAISYDNPLEVIGVVSNFKFQSPAVEDEIGPLMFQNQPGSFSFMNVKVSSDNIQGTLIGLEETWKEIDPVHSFQYRFFDDQLVAVNQWLGDIASIIGFIAFLAITIACLGMLGMAIYTTERRRKEVSIRKILGAEDRNIIFLLSRVFLTILLTSILVGAPLSFLINRIWLRNFPNRVDFGWDIVFMGVSILLILGSITIGSQTIIASRRNPIDSLKNE
ncbi:MAG: ABC transporter permease [Cytophagales bacterium]|nr:ABC transporter permease [Cytophagales bacterium]